MHFADAHIHCCEKEVSGNYPDLENADLLLSCSAQYRDWAIQDSLTEDRYIRFYGIHPWYQEQWDLDVKDELAERLEKDRLAQVGEIGLDNKRPDLERQMGVFTSQVMIAGKYGRCINVHNQGCDGDIVRILKKNGGGCNSIILHSFKGPNVKPFSGLDCYFSMNPRMLGKPTEKLKEMMRSIPEDRILIETDAPFLSKNFESMESFINVLADLLGCTPEHLAEISIENARKAVR